MEKLLEPGDMFRSQIVKNSICVTVGQLGPRLWRIFLFEKGEYATEYSSLLLNKDYYERLA